MDGDEVCRAPGFRRETVAGLMEVGKPGQAAGGAGYGGEAELERWELRLQGEKDVDVGFCCVGGGEVCTALRGWAVGFVEGEDVGDAVGFEERRYLGREGRIAWIRDAEEHGHEVEGRIRRDRVR